MSCHALVPLGEVLIPDRDEVAVEPTELYRTAGIYSFGRGVFERAPVMGADQTYTTLFRLHADQFVVSRLNGWEGAVDVVQPQVDGCFVSNEYPTFAIRREKAEPRYLYWVCRWPNFWEALIPRGSMVRRKRVKPEQLITVEIPLPEINDQRRIASKLDSLLTLAATTQRRSGTASVTREALVEAAVDQLIDRGRASGWPLRQLSDLADVNPRPVKLASDEPVAFVPMSAVDDLAGRILWPEERVVTAVSTGYKQFRTGDVIFARITPCMQNGKSAVVEDLASEHAFGSSEFHVLRPGPDLLAEWLHRIVRSRNFRAAAAERFTGTAGQQRVPVDFLVTTEIPVPTTLAEQQAAVDAIDRLLQIGGEIRDRQHAQDQRLEALTPSLLNHAFAGLL